MELKTYLVG